MTITKADRDRLESALVSLQMQSNAIGRYDLGSARSLVAAVVAGGPLDRPARRIVLLALLARAQLHLGHIRRGRTSARIFTHPDPGTYYATRPAEERAEHAARQVADEPKHRREVRACRRLRGLVRGLPVGAAGGIR